MTGHRKTQKNTDRSVLIRVLPWSLIACVYVLHQDVWFWPDPRPLVFGFLPIGLAYHAAYCLAAAVVMWTLTKLAWPTHLEAPAGDERR